VRLLLDECVDRRLAREIRGHDAATVRDLGWAGIRNGDLLAQASGRFDVFVTVDRNLAFQQRTADLPFAVVALRARTNRLADLEPLVPALSTGSPTSGTVREL
jgi:predicted nuclease of predicted toxin-antitoxin system